MMMVWDRNAGLDGRFVRKNIFRGYSTWKHLYVVVGGYILLLFDLKYNRKPSRQLIEGETEETRYCWLV